MNKSTVIEILLFLSGALLFFLLASMSDRLTALETQSAQAHSGVIENASVRPVGSIEIGSGS